MIKSEPILDVQHLSVSFSQYTSAFGKEDLKVIHDLNVKVYPGEMVAVVGASGSGKSLLAHAILGILPYNAALEGQIMYDSQRLTLQRAKRLRGQEIVLVPQSVAYLDPLMKVGAQIRKSSKTKAAKEKVSQLLSRYGLSKDTKNLYPFELSGGMARRVLISTAVMENPRLVIADEPTPGLHMDVAKRVMSHFREMADTGAGILLITHDLELAIETADRIVVFYSGTTLEEAPATDFSDASRLRHPYTKALWHAMPKNGFHAIAGMQPYSADRPTGCPFMNSCQFSGSQCSGEIPYVQKNNGYVRCIREAQQ